VTAVGGDRVCGEEDQQMPNSCAQGRPLLPETSSRQPLMTAVSWLTPCVGFAVLHAPVMAQPAG